MASVEQKYVSLRKRSIPYAKIHDLPEIVHKMAKIFLLFSVFCGFTQHLLSKSSWYRINTHLYIRELRHIYLISTSLTEREKKTDKNTLNE